MSCFLGTEEGDQTDLHGLMALTVMSLDTHPAQCPGRPRRGPGMISSRTAETSLISQWTQLVYKWGMDAWSLRLPTRNGPKETTVPDGDHLPSNFGFAPHNNSVSYMVFLQTTVTEMQTSTSSFPHIRSHHYLLMNALPPFQLRKPHEKPHIISSLNMKCHRFFFPDNYFEKSLWNKCSLTQWHGWHYAVCFTRWMWSMKENMSNRTKKEQKRNSENLICKKHSDIGKQEMSTEK